MALTSALRHIRRIIIRTHPTQLVSFYAFLLLVCLWAEPIHAVNHAPMLKLSALKNRDEMVIVSEDTPLKSFLGLLVVSDPDQGMDGQVLCEIDSQFVGLDPMSPNYYRIELINFFDHELTDREEVYIRCTDMGTPPLSKEAHLVIAITDTNDNVPTFDKADYSFSVKENSKPGDVIGTVKAEDLDQGDNGRIEYSLEDEHGGDATQFAIDVLSGQITANATFDRETQEEIVLYVFATDHGAKSLIGEAMVIVTVNDVNDNTPTIVTQELSIREEQPAGSRVGTINAMDLDTGKNADIEFTLVTDDDGSAHPPFIVELNGTVYAAVPLDRERRDEYVIQVTASDAGNPPMSSTATIRISVADINDHTPVIFNPKTDDYFFTTNSSETVSVDWTSPEEDRLVYKVTASDQDLGPNGDLHYAIGAVNGRPLTGDSLFAIDEVTGRLSLRRYVRGDDKPVQLLSLLVSDGGEPPQVANARLNVTLDVDFSSLTTPAPRDLTGIPFNGTNHYHGNDGNNSATRPSVSILHLSSVLCLLVVMGCRHRLTT